MPRSAPTADSRALADIAQRFHEHQMAADPLAATSYGLPVHRDRLPDLTSHGQARIRTQAVALRAEAAAVDPGGLDDGERTSRTMLLQLLGHDIEEIDAGWVEFAVDAFKFGPQVAPLTVMSRAVIAEAEGAAGHLARLAGMRAYLQDALERHRDGVARGRTPVHRGVAAAIAQSRATAAQPPEDAPMLEPLRQLGDGAALETGRRLWTHATAPAFAAYADGLVADIAPHARPDDRAGLCWLDGGEDLYLARLRRFTTLSQPDPDAIHQTGLEAIARLGEEYAEIGGRHLGVTDLATISQRLRHDPQLNYAAPTEIVPHAQHVADMAAQAITHVIGRVPTTPCVVRAIPEVEARGAAGAYYQQPAPGRPHGTYWVNTTDPAMPRYKAEATCFHETQPGHHTQLGLQVELDLPTFRRFGTILSGFVEGWALYTERLAREIGLYSGDLGLLGMLATDSMRACRLVVDTGLHHRGWSRQQAVAFMEANSPLPQATIQAEVDRYLVYQGQACSYMLGRLEIQRLRAEAEQRLGAPLDLRAFHDVVLAEGSVPLDVLADTVGRWITDTEARMCGRPQGTGRADL
ncbi:MAG TPA: DUF885 domain-containing protein [Euzebya sp.]|nr:DUF885 domain-containing protein [Euzebya sp.]